MPETNLNTGLNTGPHTGDAADALALRALAWTLADAGRAQKLLDLTGLDPAELRARAGEPAVLAAALGFLEAHEADLVSAADALDVRPEALVRARAVLEAGA